MIVATRLTQEKFVLSYDGSQSLDLNKALLERWSGIAVMRIGSSGPRAENILPITINFTITAMLRWRSCKNARSVALGTVEKFKGELHLNESFSNRGQRTVRIGPSSPAKKAS